MYRLDFTSRGVATRRFWRRARRLALLLLTGATLAAAWRLFSVWRTSEGPLLSRMQEQAGVIEQAHHLMSLTRGNLMAVEKLNPWLLDGRMTAVITSEVLSIQRASNDALLRSLKLDRGGVDAGIDLMIPAAAENLPFFMMFSNRVAAMSSHMERIEPRWLELTFENDGRKRLPVQLAGTFSDPLGPVPVLPDGLKNAWEIVGEHRKSMRERNHSVEIMGASGGYVETLNRILDLATSRASDLTTRSNIEMYRKRILAAGIDDPGYWLRQTRPFVEHDNESAGLLEALLDDWLKETGHRLTWRNHQVEILEEKLERLTSYTTNLPPTGSLRKQWSDAAFIYEQADRWPDRNDVLVERRHEKMARDIVTDLAPVIDTQLTFSGLENIADTEGLVLIPWRLEHATGNPSSSATDAGANSDSALVPGAPMGRKASLASWLPVLKAIESSSYLFCVGEIEVRFDGWGNVEQLQASGVMPIFDRSLLLGLKGGSLE